MKKSLYLGASMLAVAAAAIVPASAADIYRGEPGGYKDGPVYAPVSSWTGFYVGINGGYGWNAGRDTATANAIDDNESSASSQARLDSRGGFGGGQIGYNWQHGQVVYGVEADLQGAGINGRAKTGVEADPLEVAVIRRDGTDVFTGVSVNSSLDWFGTARGRLGYAFDRTLVYATGGLAFGGVKDRLSTSVDFGSGATSFPVQKDDTRVGFALGGGLEYALTPAWSLKGEYQYINLGSSNLTSNSAPNSENGTGSLKVDHTYHTARVGLNYHVGQSYEPLK